MVQWLEGAGVVVEFDAWPCDLEVVGEFSEILESFFDDAKKHEVKRFLCVLSAISGLGKDGLEKVHKSLEIAAIQLSHKKRESSWLWIEPSSRPCKSPETLMNRWFAPEIFPMESPRN